MNELEQALWQVWSSIAADAMRAMESDGASDADYLAETLLTVADTYLTGENLQSWRELNPRERQQMALDTVIS